jgi:Domain of unknown function (DUF6378)
MTNHTDILRKAAVTLTDRGGQYGPADECFERIAKIASLILNKMITPYDVAVIQMAVKLGRMPESRHDEDHYVDLVNYASFAAEFSRPKEEPVRHEPVAQPVSAPKPMLKTSDLVMDEMEADIAKMAQKLAPASLKQA